MPTIPTNLGNPQGTDIAVETALPFIGNVSRQDLQSTLGNADAELSKLYEDRNVVLTQGGELTYNALGTQLSTTEDLFLEINSQVAGGTPTLIDLGPGPFNIPSSGTMIYAVIDRIGGTAVITDSATTLPAVVAANQEVFLIAKRDDAGDGTKRLYVRGGQAYNAGQTARLGQVGSGVTFPTSSLDLQNLGIAASIVAGSSEVIATSTTNTGSTDTTATTNWVGQSFTATESGTVDNVILSMDWSSGTQPTGSMYVGVYTYSAGSPGTLLGTSNAIDAGTLTNSFANITFNFSSGPSLSAATQYFFVLQPTGVTFNGSDINIAWGTGSGGAPYDGGNAVYSTDSGSTYTPNPVNSLVFIINANAGSSLLVAIKQFDGATDPSGSSPVNIAFRDSTITSGAYNDILVQAALNLTVPSGSTLGLNSGVNQNMYVYGIDNGGTVALAVCGSAGNIVDEGQLQNTVAITSSPVTIAQYTTAPNISGYILTNNAEWPGQQFQATATAIVNSTVWNLYSASGTYSGSVTSQIYTDNAGVPGILLDTSAPVNIEYLAPGNITFVFGGATTLNSGTLYHTVLNFSGVTYGGGGTINMGSVSPSGYAYSSEVTNSSGASWTSFGTSYGYYFQVLSNGSSTATNNATLYSSSTLSNVPVRLIGRITLNEPTSGVFSNPPVALSVMPFYVDPAAIIGETRSGYVTEAQFQAQNGYGWVLCDGRSVVGSAYNFLTGNTSIPDERGTFPRMKDNGRGLDPNGDLPLGTYEADAFQDHVHATYLVKVTGSNGVNANTPTNYSEGTTTTLNAASGNPGTETAPKATVKNVFIRINY